MFRCRHHRFVVERLETRTLMAGDTNVGPYLIDVSDATNEPVATIVASTAIAESSSDVEATNPVAEDQAVVDAGRRDEVLTSEESWQPTPNDPTPSPDIPATEPPKNDSADDQAWKDLDVAAKVDDESGLSPPAELRNFGTGTPAPDRGLTHATIGSEPPLITFSSVNTRIQRRLTNEIGASPDSTPATARATFHYYTNSNFRTAATGPSLTSEPLAVHVQHDPFVAMSLLMPKHSPSSSADEPHSASLLRDRPHTENEARQGDFVGVDPARDSLVKRTEPALPSSQLSQSLTTVDTPVGTVGIERLIAAHVKCIDGEVESQTDQAVAVFPWSTILNNNGGRQLATVLVMSTIVTMRRSSKQPDQQATSSSTR